MSSWPLNFESYLFACKKVLLASLALISLCSKASTLDEAIESAIKYDPGLAISKLSLMAADENIAIAKSRLLPQINLQGATNQLSQTTIQELPGGGNSSRTFVGPSVNHQLVIRQALLRPKELSALTVSSLQVEYMALKYRFDTEDLRSRVIFAWLELLAAKQVVAAWEASMELTRESVNQEINRYSKGDSTKDILAEMNGQAQNIYGNYLQAVEAFKVKKNIFNNLTKKQTELNREDVIPLDIEEKFTENERLFFLRKISEESIEVRMSKIQEAVQLERVKIAEAEHKPTLDITAAFNIARNDATSTQGYQYKNKQIGIQYAIPIYAGGGLAAGDKQALFSYQSSILESEVVTNRLFNDFDTNWSLLIGNSVRKKGLNELFKAAEEQLMATKRSYQLGVKTISDLASIQQLHTRRLVDLIIISQDYYKAMYKIKKEIYK